MGSLVKGLIGKEDIYFQTNTGPVETFDRLGSTGSTYPVSKIPDFIGGTGKINVAEATIADETVVDSTITNATITNLTIGTALAVDPTDITETIALGTLTHDVLKSKINAILAALRTAGII